jgi:hypothetical protein
MAASGIYFRVKREDKYENICFEDLTQTEQLDFMEGRGEEWLKDLAIKLSETINLLENVVNIDL